MGYKTEVKTTIKERRSKTAPKKRSKNKKDNFKDRVLAVIKSRAETKQAFTNLTPTDFNSGILTVSDNLKIIPNIAVGTADNQRIGDQIYAQKLTLRGIIQLLPQTTSQNAGVCKVACRIMIVTPKSFPNWSTAGGSTVWQNYLLKKGGTVTQFTGAIDDLFAPVNRDAVTLHYNKVFYMNQGYYFGSSSFAVPYEQNNLVKFFRKTFRWKNKCLKYDSNIDSGLTPSNIGMVLVMGYCFVDGSSPDSLNTRVRLQYDAILDYEDA